MKDESGKIKYAVIIEYTASEMKIKGPIEFKNYEYKNDYMVFKKKNAYTFIFEKKEDAETFIEEKTKYQEL